MKIDFLPCPAPDPVPAHPRLLAPSAEPVCNGFLMKRHRLPRVGSPEGGGTKHASADGKKHVFPPDNGVEHLKEGGRWRTQRAPVCRSDISTGVYRSDFFNIPEKESDKCSLLSVGFHYCSRRCVAWGDDFFLGRMTRYLGSHNPVTWVHLNQSTASTKNETNLLLMVREFAGQGKRRQEACGGGEEARSGGGGIATQTIGNRSGVRGFGFVYDRRGGMNAGGGG